MRWYEFVPTVLQVARCSMLLGGMGGLPHPSLIDLGLVLYLSVHFRQWGSLHGFLQPRILNKWTQTYQACT